MGERQGVSVWSCSGFLPPSAVARSLLPGVLRLPPPKSPSHPSKNRLGNTPRSKTNGFQGKCVPDACNQASNEYPVPQRGIHVLDLQLISNPSQINLPRSSARSAFYQHHLGEPVPNEEKCQAAKLQTDLQPIASVSRDRKSKQNKWMCCRK